MYPSIGDWPNKVQFRRVIFLRGDAVCEEAVRGKNEPTAHAGGHYLKTNKRKDSMNSHVLEAIHGRVLELHLTGKLTTEDYARFVPDTEEMIQRYGKIRILAFLEDFHGWDAGALWSDIKWDVRHARDIERIAVVGEARWQKWMASFCKPFTSAEIRYFEHPQSEAARAWVEND